MIVAFPVLSSSIAFFFVIIEDNWLISFWYYNWWLLNDVAFEFSTDFTILALLNRNKGT